MAPTLICERSLIYLYFFIPTQNEPFGFVLSVAVYYRFCNVQLRVEFRI